MKYLTILGIVILFSTSGCGFIPSHLFQKTVPAPLGKSPQAVEADRQAADLIAQGLQEPKSLKPVAQGLSQSLGKPKKPLPSATPEQVDLSATHALESLSRQLASMQKQIDAQNQFLAKYAGTKLEGTGFDLASWGGGAILIGLIVLAVACPPVMTLMFFAFRRLKAAAGIVVNEIENAAKSEEAKQAVDSIKANIASKMQAASHKTTSLKAVITNLKK